MPEHTIPIAHVNITVPRNRVLALIARGFDGEPDTEEAVPVVAERVDICPEWKLSKRPALDFAWIVHRPMREDGPQQDTHGWAVSDAYIGLGLAIAVGPHGTRDEAIRRAKKRLLDHGLANTRLSVLRGRPQPYAALFSGFTPIAITLEELERFETLHRRHTAKHPRNCMGKEPHDA